MEVSWVENVSHGLDGVDVIFKLPTLDEVNDVSNLKQSIWVCLTLQGFSVIVILDVGPITCIVT